MSKHKPVWAEVPKAEPEARPHRRHWSEEPVRTPPGKFTRREDTRYDPSTYRWLIEATFGDGQQVAFRCTAPDSYTAWSKAWAHLKAHPDKYPQAKIQGFILEG